MDPERRADQDEELSHQGKHPENEVHNARALVSFGKGDEDVEVEEATSSLAAAMDPIIIIVLAIIVGTLVMAMMQPMFSMYDQLDTLM